MHCVLFTVVAILFLCGSNRTAHGFTIIRSEHDIFTNLQCSGDECTESHCTMYGANCVRDGNCNYCICNKIKMNTFIRNETDPTKGKCKRDEEIVPESGRSVFLFQCKMFLYNYVAIDDVWSGKGLIGSHI